MLVGNRGNVGMSGNVDARGDWLLRVLGFAMPTTASAPANAAAPAPGDWRAARDAWQAASDTVDGQIGALQAALRASDDETLREIAEYGLNGVTGNHKVPLMAAMTEIGAGDAAAVAKAGPKALGIIQAFRSHIEGDERIEVCDDNPFGVPVAIRATLGAALARMQASLQAQLSE